MGYEIVELKLWSFKEWAKWIWIFEFYFQPHLVMKYSEIMSCLMAKVIWSDLEEDIQFYQTEKKNAARTMEQYRNRS